MAIKQYIVGNKKRGKQKSKHKPYLAFDVENDPVTGLFICASVYGDIKANQRKMEHIDEFFTDRFDLQRWILTKGKTNEGYKYIPFYLVGHNAGYDVVFIDEIIDDEKSLWAGSKFYQGLIKNTNVKVFDTLNYVRGTLGSWIETLDMEEKYGITKIPFTDDKPPSVLTKELQKRNRADGIATYHLMQYIENFFIEKANIPLKMTVGSCALEFWEKHHSTERWIRTNEDLMEFEREAYKGGRSEVFTRGEQTVYQYDVHKMYLSIMKDELLPNPCKNKFYQDGGNFKSDWNLERLFIADVDVYVPKQRLPPLPYYDKGIGKLIFPTGHFRAVFCSPELYDAVKRYGVKIEKVHRYVVYYKQGKYLSSFANWVWDEIVKYTDEKNKGMVAMLKTFGNSLYGKFGEKNGGSKWMKMCDFTGDPMDLIGKDSAERDGIAYVKVTEKDHWSKHSFPCLPAFITSYGRRKWLRKAKQYEEDVIYGDTDSIHLRITTKNLPPDEEGIGMWGIENGGKPKTNVYYRPKFYGEKKKGVPDRATFLSETKSSKTYQYDKPLRRAESIRTNQQQNKWVKIIKTLSLLDNKRIWKGNESEPINIKS